MSDRRPLWFGIPNQRFKIPHQNILVSKPKKKRFKPKLWFESFEPKPPQLSYRGSSYSGTRLWDTIVRIYEGALIFPGNFRTKIQTFKPKILSFGSKFQTKDSRFQTKDSKFQTKDSNLQIFKTKRVSNFQTKEAFYQTLLWRLADLVRTQSPHVR